MPRGHSRSESLYLLFRLDLESDQRNIVVIWRRFVELRVKSDVILGQGCNFGALRVFEVMKTENDLETV